MLQIILALLVLLVASPAHAGFIVPAIVAGIGLTGGAAFVATMVGSAVLSFGLSYIAGQLMKEDAPVVKQPVGGAKLGLRVDVDVPRSFILGWAATAGSRVYANTFGEDDDTKNADMIEIIALADTPCEGIAAYIFSEGKKRTYAVGGDGDYYADGYDGRFRFKFYDGSQTTVDAKTNLYLGLAARPWPVTAVGHGVTYLRAHYKYHQSKVPGPLRLKIVVKGMRLYDPRKDSSVSGGSGTQRYTNIATHVWTDNVMVMAYNILRGIYILDADGERQFFYGLKKTGATQLPLANWFAAMNACDDDTSETNPDPRYRCGGEITVDTEPREVIKELLKCCGGRITELGGVFTPYVDTPELASYSFTDETIVDEEEHFTPVLPMDQKINYVTGKYMLISNWVEKVAPPRRDTDLEELDGRQLPANLDAPMVQYSSQMQRLMRQYLMRARRERKHVITLPPAAFELEANKVVNWNSTRNGYVNKKFEIDNVQYHSNLCVTISITEIDPTDYDWESAFEFPEVTIELPSTEPDPLPITGFTLTASIDRSDYTTDGGKRPMIRLSWDDPEDLDKNRVLFQWRRKLAPANVQHGSCNDPTVEFVNIVGGLASLTDYEVRAKFDSISGNDTSWSAWLTIKTLDARLTANDFSAALNYQITTQINQDIATVKAANDALAAVVNDLQNSTLTTNTLETRLVTFRADLKTQYESYVQTSIGPTSALGIKLESLQSSVGELNAVTQARFVTSVSPITGAIAAYDLEVKISDGADGHLRAGMQAVVRSVGGVKTSYILLDASKILFGAGSTSFADYKPVVSIDSVTQQVVINGTVLARSLKAASAEIGSLSAITAKLGKITSGEIVFEGTAGIISITSTPLQLLISKKTA